MFFGYTSLRIAPRSGTGLGNLRLGHPRTPRVGHGGLVRRTAGGWPAGTRGGLLGCRSSDGAGAWPPGPGGLGRPPSPARRTAHRGPGRPSAGRPPRPAPAAGRPGRGGRRRPHRPGEPTDVRRVMLRSLTSGAIVSRSELGDRPERRRPARRGPA
jgi:hypothetical protein